MCPQNYIVLKLPLTARPVNTGVLDWSLENGSFRDGGGTIHRLPPDEEFPHSFEGPISPENSRAMIVEFKNLHVQKAVRHKPVKCAFGRLTSDAVAKPAACGTTPAVP